MQHHINGSYASIIHTWQVRGSLILRACWLVSLSNWVSEPSFNEWLFLKKYQQDISWERHWCYKHEHICTNTTQTHIHAHTPPYNIFNNTLNKSFMVSVVFSFPSLFSFLHILHIVHIVHILHSSHTFPSLLTLSSPQSIPLFPPPQIQPPPLPFPLHSTSPQKGAGFPRTSNRA